MKIFTPHPNRCFASCSDGKTGEIKFTSIEILWAEWTTRNKCDKKSFIRSFTHTFKEKLSIGPSKRLVLLIVYVATSVLVSYDCDVSRGEIFSSFSCYCCCCYSRSIDAVRMRSWNFCQCFFINENQKEKGLQSQGGLKKTKEPKWAS